VCGGGGGGLRVKEGRCVGPSDADVKLLVRKGNYKVWWWWWWGYVCGGVCVHWRGEARKRGSGGGGGCWVVGFVRGEGGRGGRGGGVDPSDAGVVTLLVHKGNYKVCGGGGGEGMRGGFAECGTRGGGGGVVWVPLTLTWSSCRFAKAITRWVGGGGVVCFGGGGERGGWQGWWCGSF
jgi:hypothetical protein